MSKKVGCPNGTRRIKGECIRVLQKPVKASWCRKSNVGEEYPFDVVWTPKRTGYSDWYEVKSGTPILEVSKRSYDTVAKTIDSFPKEVLQEGYNADILKPRGYSKGKALDVFVITDGKRQLIVDPQGYDYPRYKSPVKKDGKVLPY